MAAARAPTGKVKSAADAERSDRPKGALIAVEGIDGSGKSTQVHLLHEFLKGRGCKVYFSTWNSSDLVKTATKRGKKEQLLTPTTFSVIHATDFADRYERQILPRLQAGYIQKLERLLTAHHAIRSLAADPRVRHAGQHRCLIAIPLGQPCRVITQHSGRPRSISRTGE